MMHNLRIRHIECSACLTDPDRKGYSWIFAKAGFQTVLGLFIFFFLVASAKPQSAPLASMEGEEARIPARFRVPVRSLIVESVDPTRMIPAPGAIHPEVAGSRDVGPVERSLVMEHLQLVLRRSEERQVAFDTFVEALHKPGSDIYHRWLEPDDIGTEFGPSQTDVETVREYLESEGFVVNRVGKSGMFIDFTGTAQQVEDSFHTEIHYVITSDDRRRYSAITMASLPEAFAPLVAGFASISNIEARAAFSSGLSRTLSAQAQPDATGTCSGAACYYVGPQDFYTIYGETPLLTEGKYDGSGATIALLEQSDINKDDVAKFRQLFNVVPNVPALATMNGTSGYCADPGIAADEHEAVLDAEWAGAVAPGARLLFVACDAGATQGILLSAEVVIDGNLASIMSLSYISAEVSGASPANDLAAALWEQAAAQGQAVVVCAGDTGSATNVSDMHQIIASKGIAVNAFASTAYNVAAGGTEFQDMYNEIQGDFSYGPAHYWSNSNSEGDSSALSYVPETTWNDSCAGSLLAASKSLSVSEFCDTYPTTYNNGGGSGGISINHPRPSWQDGTVYGLPPTSGANNYRLVPDISFFASSGLAGWGHKLLYYQSDQTTPLTSGGGTSFVAPQVAGIFALIEQKIGSRLGQPNYVLYSLAGTAFGTTSFTGTGCNGSGTTSSTGVTASSPNNSCVFYDIVSGSNSQECTASTPECYSDKGSYGVLSTSLASAQPAYLAGQGYDLATGIGSANIGNLVNAWPTTPSFTATVSPGAITIAAGQSGTATVTVASVNGFSAPVTLTCGDLPPEASCSFNHPSVTPNASGTTSVLNITTTAETALLWDPSHPSRYPAYSLLIPGLAIALRRRGRRNRAGCRAEWRCLPVLILAIWPVLGCEHHSKPGTPTGTYTVNVTASLSGTNAIDQSASVSVTVTN